MKFMWLDVQGGHLLIRDFYFPRIFPLVQLCFDLESGLGFGGPDQLHDDLMTDERPPSPVHTDVREKPVLNLVR